MRLSLDKAWRRCLPMWRWMVERYKSGATKSILDLKQQWFDTHEPDAMATLCYFCEYAGQNQFPRKIVCKCCPGALVDRTFTCYNSDYHYIHKPVKFLAKLESLNRIRLTKRKKGSRT